MPWSVPHRRILLGLGSLGLVATATVATPASGAGAASSAARFHDADGIHVVSVKRIDDRQLNVSVRSAALGRPVDVRLLLPADYARSRSDYPVLYLFHGTSGRASDWVRTGDAEKATAGLPLIVVMPDAGFDGNGGGWFTDWYDAHTKLGPSKWETFHVRQLIPWVDDNLRTIAQRAGRAVAGLSQGGFGSMTYAARHPDMFVSAASFSGAPEIDHNPVVAVGATAVIEATAFGLDGVEPEAMFGSRVTNEINWQGHDPSDLGENLRGMDIWLYTASGAPGDYDPTVPNPGAMGIETLTHGSTFSFEQHMEELHVPTHYVDYVFGTHSWQYWARDLRWYLKPMMRTFTDPPAPPRRITYGSIDRHWSQWGWTVAMDRANEQDWSSLHHADQLGFEVTGTGTAHVTTPAYFSPSERVVAQLSGSGGKHVEHLVADAHGRLRLTVPLGDPYLASTTTVQLQH